MFLINAVDKIADTKGSAIAERPRNSLRQLKIDQLLHSSTSSVLHITPTHPLLYVSLLPLLFHHSAYPYLLLLHCRLKTYMFHKSWPRRVLPPDESRRVLATSLLTWEKMGQTDERTDARPMLYAYQ